MTTVLYKTGISMHCYVWNGTRKAIRIEFAIIIMAILCSCCSSNGKDHLDLVIIMFIVNWSRFITFEQRTDRRDQSDRRRYTLRRWTSQKVFVRISCGTSNCPATVNELGHASTCVHALAQSNFKLSIQVTTNSRTWRWDQVLLFLIIVKLFMS